MAGLLLSSLSPMAGLPPRRPNKKSASPKNTTAYSLQDRIVFVGKWVNCLFGCFAHPFYGGGGWVPIFRNYSAMQ